MKQFDFFTTILVVVPPLLKKIIPSFSMQEWIFKYIICKSISNNIYYNCVSFKMF